METTYSASADIEAVGEKQLSQDNKDFALSVLRPLHLIERFCQVAESGAAPPQWMIDALYRGFASYLACEGGEPLAACFKITRGQFDEKPPDNVGEMMEAYAMLKYLFDMTHDKTAEVIKLWYDYPHKTGTLGYQFKHVYQQAHYSDKWTSDKDEEMTVTARATQFLEKLKVTRQDVFTELKKRKHLFKRNKNHPAFK